jgi:uncharacterized protein YndB with AHSA1/START domain
MTEPDTRVVYQTYIATTAEELWQALTDPTFTRRYWYGRLVESSWEVGSPIRYTLDGTDDIDFVGEVLACEPHRRLSYTFTALDPDAEPEPPSRVTFELAPAGPLMKLTVVHDRLVAGPNHDGARDGWSIVLCALKTLLETGRPLPLP